MQRTTAIGKWQYAALAAVVLVLGAGAAHATTILVDFGNDTSFRGASVTNPDGNGNFWNSIDSSVFNADMIDKGGAATTIDIGFDSVTGTDYFNGPSGATQDPTATVYNAGALGDLGVDEAVYDYYVSSTFQIQGLDPTKTYNLEFYGSHKFNPAGNDTTVYTAYTDSSYSSPVVSASLLVGVNSAHNEENTVALTGLAPQGPDNYLFIGFEGISGGNGYLNAMRIVEVPEPGSLMLLATGCGLLARRRRR
jgi:hypothetical protein